MYRPFKNSFTLLMTLLFVTSLSSTGCREYLVDANLEEDATMRSQSAQVRPDSTNMPCYTKFEYCIEADNEPGN